MSDENGTTPPAGEHARRLDADRTREELADTLDEIEGRLSPKGLLESLRRAWRSSPITTAAVLAAPVVLVGSVIALRAATHRRRG